MGVIDFVLELNMLKNSLIRVPKKAHAYFSNKNIKMMSRKIKITQPLISRDDI